MELIRIATEPSVTFPPGSSQTANITLTNLGEEELVCQVHIEGDWSTGIGCDWDDCIVPIGGSISLQGCPFTMPWTEGTYHIHALVRVPSPLHGIIFDADIGTIEILASGETRFEYYDAGDNEHDVIAERPSAQTFVPSITHDVTSVWIKAGRFGDLATYNSSEIVAASIQEVDVDGHPTGIALCSEVVMARLWPTEPEWHGFAFAIPARLYAGTQYALVIYLTEVDEYTGYVKWRLNTSGGYPNGCVQNIDGLGNWYDLPYDFMFEEWGIAV